LLLIFRAIAGRYRLGGPGDLTHEAVDLLEQLMLVNEAEVDRYLADFGASYAQDRFKGTASEVQTLHPARNDGPR
jgi:hypothetical protein